MIPADPDHVTCPDCGTSNEPGDAVCANCNRPLTGYAGDLSGGVSADDVEARLRQVARQDARPVAVSIVMASLAGVVLFWPVIGIFRVFLNRVPVNDSGTNYLAAAIGGVASVVVAVFYALLGLALAAAGVVAWLRWDIARRTTVAALAAGLAVALFSAAMPVPLRVMTGACAATGIAAWYGGARAWYGN